MNDIWINPWWVFPPHRVTHPDKVTEFANHFASYGWAKFPVLTGYWHWPAPDHPRVQLLTGTHRHAAAKLVDIEIPVVVWAEWKVERAWGDLQAWKELFLDTNASCVGPLARICKPNTGSRLVRNLSGMETGSTSKNIA